jgi:hypothetical protein
MTMRGASDHAAYPAKRRKPARSRVMRDLAADWQRWTPAERLIAGLLFGAIWLTVSSFYLTQIFHD